MLGVSGAYHERAWRTVYPPCGGLSEVAGHLGGRARVHSDGDASSEVPCIRIVQALLSEPLWTGRPAQRGRREQIRRVKNTAGRRQMVGFDTARWIEEHSEAHGLGKPRLDA